MIKFIKFLLLKTTAKTVAPNQAQTKKPAETQTPHANQDMKVPLKLALLATCIYVIGFFSFSLNCDVQQQFFFSVISASMLKPLNEQWWLTIDEI